MMMTIVIRIIKLKLLIIVLISVSTITTYSQPDNKKIIEAYKQVPSHIAKSQTKLVEYLTSQESSNAQKAFSIYVWMVNNITYDLKPSKKIKVKRHTSKQTLRRRKGINFEYANLFSNLCEIAGVPSKVIFGYSKAISNYFGEPFYEANYTWNSIKVGSDWQLLDISGGAGFVIKKEQKLKYKWSKLLNKPFINNKYKFVNQPNYENFNIDSRSLINNYLPVDPVWQLVEYPVSLKSFESKDWNGYKDEKDNWVPKHVNKEEYEALLSRYEFISPNQYYFETAKNTNVFNPLNFELLARYYFIGASSIYLMEKNQEIASEKFERAISNYKLAILYSNKQSKVVARESKKNIKAIGVSTKNEFLTPINKLSKKNSKWLKIADNRFSKEERLLNNQSNRIVKYKADIEALIESPLKKREGIKGIDSIKILDNINIIDVNKTSIIRKIDSVNLRKSNISNLISDKFQILESLLLLTERMNIKIISSTLLVEENKSSDEQEIAMHSLYALTLVADSLKKIIAERDISIMDSYRKLNKKNSEIDKVARSSRQLLKGNCSFSNEASCDNISNHFFFNAVNFKLQSGLDVELLLLEMLKKDYRSYKKKYELLEIENVLLQSYSNLVSYSSKRVISDMSLKRDRSLYEMRKIKNKSAKKVKYLSKKTR